MGIWTSSCDRLHRKEGGKGVGEILEMHGSLRFLQCSTPCCDEPWEVGDAFRSRLEAEEDWVPRCD